MRFFPPKKERDPGQQVAQKRRGNIFPPGRFGIFYHFLAGKRFAEGREQVNKSVGLPSFFQLNQISPMGGFLRAASNRSDRRPKPGSVDRSTLRSDNAQLKLCLGFQENGGSKKVFHSWVKSVKSPTIKVLAGRKL